MNQSRVKILLFVLVSVAAIALLAIAVQRFNIFAPRASGAVPQLITVSNLTDTTVTISWTTEANSVLTNLQWGESKLLGNTETDFRDKRDKTTKPRTTHYVEIKGLRANTTYSYRIVSGDSTYPDTANDPSTFKTLAGSSASQPNALTVYGDVSGQDTDVIVTVYVPGALGYTSIIPVSSVLNTDGTWFVNIATARNSNGTYINPAANIPIVVSGIGTNGNGYVANIASNKSPITLKLETPMTQAVLDKVLLAPLTITTSTTATPTPTVTKNRQDVPLQPIGTTATTTPTVTTGIPEEASITREQLIASFASPSISNVTDSSLSIMFVTSATSISSLNWGASATSLTSNRFDDKDSSQATAKYLHHYTLTGLTANKQYFFKPTADNTVRTFTTPAQISAPSGQTIITGNITNGTGECLVRTQIQRNTIFSSVITTLPNSLNTWAINVMPIRTSALDTYMIPVATDTVLTNAFCIASNGDVSYQAASTTLQSAVTSGITLTLVKLQ